MDTTLKQIIDNVEQVIIGKREVVELALCAVLAKGHVLIEDMPGVGKTSLVSALARSFDCSFKRIQFTPDIMPSDITGFSIYRQNTGNFEYHPGAIMSQMILADEINRTAPKTQSSLLEVMEEGQVSVDGVTYPVPQPFMVFATQNPMDYLGTYPLPEAQLDRFFMKLSIGYPSAAQERAMLSRFKLDNPLGQLQPVVGSEQLLALQQQVTEVHVDDAINHYIVQLVSATRTHPDILLGASPRASINLYKAAQARAFLSQRQFVIVDDVIPMAVPVLAHRLVLSQESYNKKLTAESLVERIVTATRTPV